MKILVDGDACPVKQIILKVAREFGLTVLIFHSTSHFGHGENCQTVQKIMVDNEFQAVDMAIINKVEPEDIVVTGDFGLAGLVLSKKAAAISFNGRQYNNENIDKLLFERYLSAKIRKVGGRAKGPAKRTAEDNENFELCLKNLILNKLKDIY